MPLARCATTTLGRTARVAQGALLVLMLGEAGAQAPAPAPAGPRIYSCTTADGRKLTSDRPIAECLGREQRVLRHDGAARGTLPPAMSPEERAAAEVRQREELVKKAALADATRYDRNLLTRYPQQDRHDAARQAALDDLTKASELSQKRLASLAKDRKALDTEAEFYTGKPLPPKLKQQIDANEAAAEAQRQILEQQAQERDRVNRRYDIELLRLKKLWSGTPPGSLGPPPSHKDLEAGSPKPPAKKK
jgi:hypothetical protein